MSDSRHSFTPDSIQVFDFHTDLPTPFDPKTDWIEKRPIPVNIELVAKGETKWMVAYFRWHIDRFRLFFGELDWSHTPAGITEIHQEDLWNDFLSKVKTA